MSVEADESRLSVFTIGHSNHPIDHFLGLLDQHHVDVLVDTRSSPYSKFAPQFNTDTLAAALRRTPVKYLYLGRELGGRPDGAEYYDADGHVLYDRVAQRADFLAGIDRVLDGAARCRMALLCSEEDPAGCHRRLLVGRVLAERGVVSRHIRGDGKVQSEEQVVAENKDFDDSQPLLFQVEDSPAWKSLQSVSGKKPPKRSSAS